MEIEKKWYIVNTQTSCENVAKKAIEERIRTLGLEDQFGEILIPAENIVELVRGKKSTKVKKFFPGYIFVQMILSEKNWHLVKNAAKVTGFLGGAKPQAVTAAEVEKVTRQMVSGADKPKHKATFAVGDSVIVVDGPFSNFNGTVEDINEEKAKVKVSVSIFGRPTPVELDFIKVDKN